MKCKVWKSSRKEYTYIYLAPGMDFDDLPSSLRDVFGEPEFVMGLDFTPTRRLAYADASVVRENLSEQGYHLQLPPQEDATGLLELIDKKETLE